MVELARLKIDEPNLFTRCDTVNSLINYLSAADVKINWQLVRYAKKDKCKTSHGKSLNI